MTIAARPVDDPEPVRESHGFGRHLVVTRAALSALNRLRPDGDGDPHGIGLGLILATDHGDQHVLAQRAAEFAEMRHTGEVAPAELFRAIAYFPNGRVLKNLADNLPARGPLAVMVGDQVQARRLAGLWQRSGRARAVAIVRADRDPGTGAVFADAELCGETSGTPPEPVTVSRAVHATGSLAGSAESVIRLLRAQARCRRVALVAGSMLGSAGDALYATIAPRQLGPDLETVVHRLARELAMTEVFLLVGSSGMTVTGLAIAQDLIAADEADEVIVCGVETLDGAALQAALGVLRCGDLPHMVGGAAAVLVGRASTPGSSRLSVLSLDSPIIPVHPRRAADLTWLPPLPESCPRPQVVDLSGITDLDLACAGQMAERLCPGCRVGNQGDRRSVAADVLVLASQPGPAGRPRAIVAAHSFGGTGVCLLT